MYKKVIASLLVVCLIVATSVMVIACDTSSGTSTTGLPGAQSPDFPSEGAPSGSASELEDTIGNAWATVAFVVQALSIGCIVVLGLRYMFASADKRADIKHGLTMVVIGSVFTFCAATVARFVVDAGSDIL